jgi:3-dehydrotetronate 4-kinase
VIAGGEEAISVHVAHLKEQGVGIAILDAVSNADLLVLGRALARLPLLTAGSGLAIGLPVNFSITPSAAASSLPTANGPCAVLSGSCSVATNFQVKHFLDAGLPSFAIDPVQLAQGVNVVQQALDWAALWVGQKPVLVYSTAYPLAVKTAQALLGVHVAGEMVEKALSDIARGLLELGVGQLIVAGGETSGACVQALGITRMQVGVQVAPGVPWCHAVTGLSGRPVHILLKSGNFGAPDIFTQAFELLR